MKRRLLSALLAMAMLLTMVPAAFAADGDTPGESVESTENISAQGNESEETPDEPGAPTAPEEDTTVSADAVYVSASTGNDETGDGSEKSPYATLAKAVEKAKDGATIYVMSDLTASSLALVDKKNITIDGNNKTITRADDFTPTNDQGRGGYNPAMIEVANGSTLTLKNITLDDKFLHKGEKFDLASGTSGNEQKVHDGIIASYGDGKSTIILDEGTTLKNFGGLAAVYITGEDGEGARLIMKSGSKICDDGTGSRQGGYAAIFNHGGTVTMDEGSSIESIDGRAIIADNAAITNINGSISDITANATVKYHTGAMNSGFGGIVLYATGKTQTTLGGTAVISDIKSNDGNSADVMLWLVGATFETEQGSVIKDINTIGLADSNGSTMRLDGRVENCHLDKVIFRVRGDSGTFEIAQNGIITNCSTSDYGIVYVQAGSPTNIIIGGTISNCEVGHAAAVNLTKNGIRSCTCKLTSTGKIQNISGLGGYGILIDGPQTKVYVEGEISGCKYKAIYYKTVSNNSILELNGGIIKNNNNGGAQIQVASTDVRAIDSAQHVKIIPNVLKGNTTIDLIPFDVTLDTNYTTIKLGQASNDAATALKDAITAKYSDWKPVGSSAVWIQPSESEIHFTVPHTSSMKKTALFAALIPLNTDGTPVSDANDKLILQEVINTDPVDVTLTGLTAGQSYALMFVNNNIYTLAPDDITIYTGGGQGNETYDDCGFPKLTIDGSVDPITKLEINGSEVTGDDLMAELLKYLTVSYTDQQGNPVPNDAEAGEYIAKLSWKDGQKPEGLRINGNEVAEDFGTGTLIVRYVENIDDAVSGDSTHALLTAEPTDKVTHAVALAKNNSKFYTNDDTDREVDAAGIQILDDSLLKYEGEDRQRPMEEKAAEYLGTPGEGRAYRYKFHYLDLVDAFNGNAWVSASGGTTVYLPYPEGVTAENAQDLNVQVIHYKDLHREYGITGQADVEQAIEACELETMEVEYDPNGIKFDVDREGFSPFAVVWQTEAHTITATAGTGGTIDPEGAVTVAEGADQKFEITADEGYHIADVKVDGKSAQLDKDNTYTFTKVNADHTIEATFASNGGGGGGGTTRYTLTYESNGGTEYKSEQYDRNTVVKLDKTPAREGYTFTGWYADKDLEGDPITEIKMTSNKTVYAGWEVTEIPEWLNGDDHFAYVIGYEDGTVRPQNDISRAEVATIFFRLLKDDVRAQYLAESNGFTDVAAGTWYNTAISTMAKMGVLDGYPDGSFRPDASITRAEFAVICARFDDSARESDSSFTDISGHWAEVEIERAATLGWINGYEDGTFRPDAEITRAEAMTLINRVLQRLPETADDLLDNMTTWSDVQPNAWYYLAVQEATNSHDFDRKADGVHETWTALTEAPDWEQYQ